MEVVWDLVDFGTSAHERIPGKFELVLRQIFVRVVFVTQKFDVDTLVAVEGVLIHVGFLRVQAARGDGRVPVMFIHFRKGLTGAQGPIEFVVRDVVSLEKDLFEHEFHFFVIWSLVELQFVGVFEQGIKKVGLRGAEVLGLGVDLVFSDVLKLVRDGPQIVDP